MKFMVEFESGYLSTAVINLETATQSEYWIEITQRQNPYDLSDKPVRVDGIALDEDGEWLEDIDAKLCKAYDLTAAELYR